MLANFAANKASQPKRVRLGRKKRPTGTFRVVCMLLDFGSRNKVVNSHSIAGSVLGCSAFIDGGLVEKLMSCGGGGDLLCESSPVSPEIAAIAPVNRMSPLFSFQIKITPPAMQARPRIKMQAQMNLV